MSEDVSDRSTSSVPGKSSESQAQDQQKIILEIASRALESGDRDHNEVFRVVKSIGLRAHLVDNLRAYATRALFRVTRRPQIRMEPLTETEPAAATDNSQVEAIEARILVRELLEVLKPTDREIFVRLMNGQTCQEIDAAMNLKPRAAEIRLAVCKNALRRVVEKRLNR